MQQVIKVLAILFIIIAIAFVAAEILYNSRCSFDCIAIASVFATLSGAILVFSTLEMQRKSLNEEKHRNETERFDSRFYPIISNFRTDASNIEITGDYISLNGIGSTASYKGEKAFAAATDIVSGLNTYLSNESIKEFEKEEFDAVLNDYSNRLEALCDNSPNDEEIDKIENERKKYIKSNQIPFLAGKWGIIGSEKKNYLTMDDKTRETFLLNTLINRQSTSFSKYIQSLRFIIHIVNAIESEKERITYYQHVSCLIGKEELEFLRCFSEFVILTEFSHEQW